MSTPSILTELYVVTRVRLILTHAQAAIMARAAQRHYDARCRHWAQCFANLANPELFGEPYAHDFSWDDVDTFVKITETTVGADSDTRDKRALHQAFRDVLRLMRENDVAKNAK